MAGLGTWVDKNGVEHLKRRGELPLCGIRTKVLSRDQILHKMPEITCCQECVDLADQIGAND